MAQYTSNIANGYQLLFNINTTSQSIADNTSTIAWSLQISTGHTYYNARHTGNAVLGGVTLWDQPDATFNSSPSRSIKTIASGTRVYAHSANGTLSLAVSAALRTISQGSSWSVPQLSISGTFTPPTIPRMANAPGVPSIYEYDNRLIILTSPVATAPSGVSITGYQIQRRDNFRPEVGWTIMDCDSDRQCWFRPEKPLTRFDFQARAHTAAGWGPWSSSYSSIVSMGSGPHVNVSGVNKYSHAFVKYDGNWLPAITWVKNAGLWKPVTR